MAASHLLNMARMTTATSGTGTITLGSAVSSFLTFAQAGVVDGDTVTYIIEDSNGTGREVGTGVYTSAGLTLTRSVINSTNSNSAISLSGVAQVALGALAQDIVNKRGDTMSGGALNWATAPTVASGASIAIGAAASNYVLISGTATINGADTIAQGAFRWLRFTGTATLHHSASWFLNNNGNDIVVAVGDIGLAISDGSGNWRYFHVRAGGLPLLNANNLSDVGTALTAFNNISPLTSRGDLLTRDASNNIRLGIGATDTIVRSSAGTDPSWSTLTSWFDAVLGSTQGLVPQRGASTWAGVAVGGALVPAADIRTASATITIPTGATKCKVTLVGGGGGGGGCVAGSGTGTACCLPTPAIATAGGPGGAAGVVVKYLSGLTPGSTLALTIGANGSGGASGNHAGTAGGDTTLASGSQSITTLTASKGNGGGAGGTPGAAGASGTGTNGDLNITGGTGSAFGSANLTANGIPGHSISGNTGMGLGPATVNLGGSGGASGANGTGYGSGGAGGCSVALASGAAQSGGNGAGGAAIFEWYI